MRIFPVLPEMSGDTWGAKLHHESQFRDSCEMVLGPGEFTKFSMKVEVLVRKKGCVLFF